MCNKTIGAMETIYDIGVVGYRNYRKSISIGTIGAIKIVS